MRTFKIKDKYFGGAVHEYPAEYQQIYLSVMGSTEPGKLVDVWVRADGEVMLSLKEEFAYLLIELGLKKDDG